MVAPASVPTWPFAASGGFARAVRRLLVATRGLPWVGSEASCRLSPGAVSLNRWLLGVDTESVAARRLQALPEVLGMPSTLAASFLASLPHARRVLLAVEHSHQGVEFKAYQEYKPWADAEDLSPALAMRGHKWRLSSADRVSEGPASDRITDYWWPTATAANGSSGVCEPGGWPQAAAPACAVVARAMALLPRSDLDELQVLVASEHQGGRRSCCFGFYHSGLRLQALRPALSDLASGWRLPHTGWIDRLPGQRRLGWLAAGLDAGEQPFLTLYGESSLTDARAAMALETPDEHL
jgi:hypothetical protein